MHSRQDSPSEISRLNLHSPKQFIFKTHWLKRISISIDTDETPHSERSHPYQYWPDKCCFGTWIERTILKTLKLNWIRQYAEGLLVQIKMRPLTLSGLSWYRTNQTIYIKTNSLRKKKKKYIKTLGLNFFKANIQNIILTVLDPC